MPANPFSYPHADYLRRYEELYASWMRAEQDLHAAPAATQAAPEGERLQRAADEALARLVEFVRSYPI